MPPIDIEEASAQLGADIAAGMDGQGTGGADASGGPRDPGDATPAGSAPSSTPASPAAGSVSSSAGAPTGGNEPAPEPQPWDAPPSTWGKVDAEKWKTLDAEFRQLAHKREQDFHKGLETYRGSHVFRQSVERIFEPHMEAMRQSGMSVEQVVPDVLAWYAAIASGDAQTRTQLFQQLAETFGVKAQFDAPYVDPNTAKLEQELAEIKGTLTAQQQREYRAQVVAAEQAVDAFLADPKNEFIKDPEVAKLTIQYLNSGVSKDISDAYEKAVYAVPTVRDKIIDRQAQQKLQAEVQRGKEAARRTAPDASGAAPSAVNTAQSLDEALAENLRSIRAG